MTTSQKHMGMAWAWEKLRKNCNQRSRLALRTIKGLIPHPNQSNFHNIHHFVHIPPGSNHIPIKITNLI